MKTKTMTTKDGRKVMVRECPPPPKLSSGWSSLLTPTHEMSEDGGKTWKPCRVTSKR